MLRYTALYERVGVYGCLVERRPANVSEKLVTDFLLSFLKGFGVELTRSETHFEVNVIICSLSVCTTGVQGHDPRLLC